MAIFKPQLADVVEAMIELQQHEAFTDFTIHLKEGPVRVSKILFAALSPVFRSMLTADMIETRTNSVHMDHITMETWTNIKEFFFGCQKLETLDKVLEVLEVSHMYQMDILTQYCCDYLQSVCSPHNCLVIRRVAAKLQLNSVFEKANRTVNQKFFMVAQGADFLYLEKSELLELLKSEELVTTEDVVCEALLAWMEDNGSDVETCSELFWHIHVEKVSDMFLQNGVLNHSVSTHTPAIYNKVVNEISRRWECGQQQLQEVPQRRRVRSHGTLVVVGQKWNGQACVYEWSASEQKWISFPGPYQTALSCASCATRDGTVFVTGGQEALNASTKTILFHPHSRKWSKGPSLLHGRACHGMSVIHDRVFVVGGSENIFYTFKCLDSVEEYNQTMRQWTHAGNLAIATDSRGVTAIGDTILILGGFQSQCEGMIQTFNVETRTAAVLDVQLPGFMPHTEAFSLGNTAFFVGIEGDLVQVTEVEGEFQITSHVQLQEFGDNMEFGLHVTDACVRVISGGYNQSVICWNHKGEKLESDEVSNVPDMNCLYGVHEVDSPSL